ncbi:hypothetical protein HAH_2054 [Haloarcula hispanica ATCC 33960]|uniref:Uncharacterized protein n=1 Tax=Haloarcula hispanica (strain ATCC 33960 / DSM 4426 / JCM 8911 / NBRC 102182 / NCIMB 2187 / VKM B-1755) TaxID=634497 RepID=G0HVM6_HALHT|nr:hypothetical protein HAH_2054 [Haloarcula hispanica ATCC 33960]
MAATRVSDEAEILATPSVARAVAESGTIGEKVGGTGQ